MQIIELSLICSSLIKLDQLAQFDKTGDAWQVHGSCAWKL